MPWRLRLVRSDILKQTISMSIALAGIFISPASSQAAERTATLPSSIRAQPEFQVELLCSAREEDGSWISMTFDDEGRVILGEDQQGLLRITLAESSAADMQIERLDGTQQLKHCRGVLYAHDSLYVCSTNGEGFYRLRDQNGDGTFEDIQLLKAFDYRSRYGHGANQIVLGPDEQIYVVCGNDVALPDGVDPRSPYRDPRNDWLLPNPHDLGQDDRVGRIFQTDPEGKRWTVIAGGMRNQVDVAFNEAGEMFTWDADMEWDARLPWYRPTRICHVVSGGEYGWRWGTGKWPDWYPDSLPAVLNTGYGSPTGLVFGTQSNWPERYRTALFAADWQNGRVLMIDLRPKGASYTATSELFLEGGPLNVCDLTFGPDGALYFITGGRGSQSGLYRVRYDGKASSSPETLASTQKLPTADAKVLSQSTSARELRRQLEALHVRVDPDQIDLIWKHLGDEDRFIRFAARVAMENQPISGWRGKVASSADSFARRTALLALARVGTAEDQRLVLKGLADAFSAIKDSQSENAHELVLPLRTLQLSLIRQGQQQTPLLSKVFEQIDPLYPSANFQANWLLGEILASAQVPDVIERTVDLLESSPTQEEQIQYAKTLCRIETGWNLASRERMLDWLILNRQLPGGKLVDATLRHLQEDTLASLADQERHQLKTRIEKLKAPLPVDAEPVLPPRAFVRNWSVDELLPAVTSVTATKTSREAGTKALAAASCLRCHRIGNRGSQIGPDLSAIGKRFDSRALLQSIIEPSKVVDPKYKYTSYRLDDGRVVTGRPVGVNRERIEVETDPISGKTATIVRADILESKIADISPMPQGLLNTLTRDEIRELVVYLLTLSAD